MLAELLELVLVFLEDVFDKVTEVEGGLRIGVSLCLVALGIWLVGRWSLMVRRWAPMRWWVVTEVVRWWTPMVWRWTVMRWNLIVLILVLTLSLWLRLWLSIRLSS